eukprot:Sspe_Gene.88390::Locus_60431_Transcript_1_1_Confidence_1.000_Length_1340::g.88390::m.88390
MSWYTWYSDCFRWNGVAVRMSFRCSDVWRLSLPSVQFPDWVSIPAVQAIAGLGIACAVLQLLMVAMSPRMKTFAHFLLQLIAVADILTCLWWCVYSPHVLGGGSYRSELECRVLEFLRITCELTASFWMGMLCILVTTAAHHFYKFKDMRPGHMKLFIVATLVVPVIEAAANALWSVGERCPATKEGYEKIEHVADAAVAWSLFFSAVCTACVVFTWARYRSKHTGFPRLLVLPISSLFGRGLGPVVYATGWFASRCSLSWLGAWGFVSASQ